MFLIVRVGDPFRLWLHFYSVFEFPPKSVFIILDSRELVWGSVWSILHSFVGSIFYMFSKISKVGTIFSDFSDSRPKKIGFGAWGRFGSVFGVSKNHRFIYHCENVRWIWADPWYKLIVYMLSSIWHMPSLKNYF